MNRLIFAASAAIPLVFVAAVAHAQTRTFVSGVGSDANPCSRTAPCQTFAGALGKTAANGEINCLDPGGYGTVNITKNITISCGWTHGSILASGTTGVIVNGAGLIVTLRGLAIQGAHTTAGSGIRILNANTVNIDDVVIENFTGTGAAGKGISIETAAAGVRVNVNNTRIFNTGNHAIHSNPTAGSVTLSVEDSNLFRGSASGIQLRQFTTAAINDTRISRYDAGAGVTLELTSATAMISNSTLSDNAHGIINGFGGGLPTSRIYANVITGNTSNGLLISGGSVLSHGNNAIRGNAGNEAPTGGSVGTQ